jgi:hypothetical protein
VLFELGIRLIANTGQFVMVIDRREPVSGPADGPMKKGHHAAADRLSDANRPSP